MLFKEHLKKFLPPSSRTFQSFVDESRMVYQRILNETHYKPNIPLYDSNFELNYLQDHGFFNAIKACDFKDKYLKLVDGLSEKSIECVNRILNRIQVLEKYRQLPLDIYTLEEKENIAMISNIMLHNIIRISNDCFVFKKYKLPLCHFESCVFFDKHGISEIETDLSKIAKKDIVDAGGFIGDSVLILSPLTEKKIYSFEPMPYNFLNLKKTMEMNNIENAVCENLALGSKNGILNFHSDPEFSNGSCSYKVDNTDKRKDVIEVPVVTLDNYVKENDLNVGLIKTDLEGMEPDFLLGAKETICSQKPVLLLSMYHNDKDFFGLKPMIESWNLGYSFKVFKGLDYGICLETMLIAEVL